MPVTNSVAPLKFTSSICLRYTGWLHCTSFSITRRACWCSSWIDWGQSTCKPTVWGNAITVRRMFIRMCTCIYHFFFYPILLSFPYSILLSCSHSIVILSSSLSLTCNISLPVFSSCSLHLAMEGDINTVRSYISHFNTHRMAVQHFTLPPWKVMWQWFSSCSRDELMLPFVMRYIWTLTIIYPRRACAARVTVVVWCAYVCVYVCVHNWLLGGC